MPRGQKSKLRAREKRCQARRETQNLGGAQAPAAEIDESPLAPASVSQGTPPSSPAAGTRQEPQGAPATSSRAAGVSGPGSDVRAKGRVEARKNSSRASTSGESSQIDPLTKQVGMLTDFLLEKYTVKEPIIKADMLKLVNKRCKGKFPEILRRAADRIQRLFGLDLKEVKPSGDSYTLVSQLDVSDDGSRSSGTRFPKSALLLPLLGVILLKGNRASEEDIWALLSKFGVHDGRWHLIFGDPRKLITEDLVQEKYLVYRQVRHSDPPRYEFLWGRRARAETSKMKVLEFVATLTDMAPSAFPVCYEEALRDEEGRARARAAATAHTRVKASARSKSCLAAPPALSEV
ncbi:melanoma-associated antigen B1-like [Mesoplodon densirostris]|uniref:melanoma-associated antigen B1-like n=1 Tax=Mesoplodon densirostris TaxID=48708 RepID=UPI0028DB41AA|nr:melanoma-associated antigen B1-like [Mesoplodon densirostris]